MLGLWAPQQNVKGSGSCCSHSPLQPFCDDLGRPWLIDTQISSRGRSCTESINLIPSRRCLCPTSARICCHYSTRRSQNFPWCHHIIRQTVKKKKHRQTVSWTSSSRSDYRSDFDFWLSKKISVSQYIIIFLNAFVYTIALLGFLCLIAWQTSKRAGTG